MHNTADDPLGQGGHQSPTQQIVAAYITHRLKQCGADQDQLAALGQEIAAWLTSHGVVRLRTIVHKQVQSYGASL